MDGQWFPYMSKLMFLLDAIDNLPRLRISGSLMRVLLWLLREVGVKKVPLFDGLRSAQKELRKHAGVPTIHWKSPKGNLFLFNDPCTLIANDWANPFVCSHIHRYPMIPPNGVISEVWHAEKWRRDLDCHILSPIYEVRPKHFYIDEIAQMKNGDFVIPLRWVEDSTGAIWADAWRVEFDETLFATISDDSTVLLKAEDLGENYLDLQDSNSIPLWSRKTVEAGHPLRMPNPDRTLAEGDPLYTCFIDVFGDDVSGNRSKSWNKHWNIYINHRNLPQKLLQQEFHTHFVPTSTHATEYRSTHSEPFKAHHAASSHQIWFKMYCNCGPGDNPAQSETLGHIGSKGNFPCRKCHAGGTQKEKETNNGFNKMFYPGRPQSSKETLTTVESQVKAACLGVAQTMKDMQSTTGIKDAYTQSWVEHLIKKARELQKAQPNQSASEIQAELMDWVDANKPAIYNSFLSMEVEILHTILLGIVKYLWHGSHTSWTTEQKKTYAIRLQSTHTTGLSIHVIRANYITQYANSLIGRQFKTLAQVNTFHVYDLVDQLQFSLTKAVGEPTALLWFPEIRNLNECLSNVDVAAANILDIAALIDPTKIGAKIKYHLLSHIREDIIRFGPMVGVATEVFESFNAIFRYCLILSNHLAPSRDIAYQLANQESIKHFLSGGWWAANGGWVQPSSNVRMFMMQNPFLAVLYGQSGGEPTIPEKKHLPCAELQWDQTRGANALNHVPHDPSAFGPITGCVLEIIKDCTSPTAYVILDVFQVLSTRHKIFDMPVLTRRFGETEILIVPAHAILFDFNAQHDCQHAKCTNNGNCPVMQERVASGNTETFIVHQPVDRYIMNTHGLHNTHLIRATLPRNLIAPIPFTAGRESHHHKIAAKF
ncbi:hypothetical protein BDZ94DRAFT_1355980 [Collybia nuda]|uniref:Uncharacterized protein n=1 Tax=Collybia nuda TaxID=64659 RepID=A0A9P6CKY7_9AGAR|nr:hypothetical protein BDZ94DRAFT_1355980 [Collybia nuda]